MSALIITTYNRPEYVSQCFDSLKKVEFPAESTVIIVDDCSDGPTKDLINNFHLKNVEVIKFFSPVNRGIKASLTTGYDIAFSFSDVVINLDGDAIVKPNFISRLLELKSEFPDLIVTGFNSRNTNRDGSLRNPIISEHDGYAKKKYANGINMCINKSQYINQIRPALGSNGNWDFNATNNDTPVIVAVPSLVEHIGLKSSMGHSDNPDVAFDFDTKRIYLPTVTLLGTDCRDIPGITRAAGICQEEIKFGHVEIVTECLYHGIQEYSKYYIQNLHKHIKTDHVLIIHADGYIQNPDAWDNSWLQYDYIGATWGYKDNMNVGNGGFSLRSKKLHEILSKLSLSIFHPEDDIICRKLRPMLEKEHGIKFAPEEVANKFSIEAYGAGVFPRGNRYSGQFGFHGYNVFGLPKPPLPKVADKPLIITNDTQSSVRQSVNQRRVPTARSPHRRP